MAKLTIQEIKDKSVWEKFVLSQNPKSFLQSWNWGEVNRENGSKIFRLGFKKNSKVAGVCLLIKESAKRGPHLILPGGPILDWRDKELARFFVKSIKELAIKEKVWFIRVRPELLDTKENRILFKKLGFRPSPMHLNAENTWVLNIQKTEEDILREMRKTTRYLIKRSEKEGLDLVISEDTKYARVLYKLQTETIKRHKFVGFSKKLFEKEIEIFGGSNQALVFSCKKGNKFLASAIIIFYGETAYYHFSGSVSEFSKIPFSYFLQWNVIKAAKKRGVKFYNFWGVAPEGVKNHRFSGVTMFKTGFGGERTDWLHAHDFPVSPLYHLTYIFESIRRIFRHL